jgi:hypothetical protein
MSAVRNLITDLVDRRLWPVAVALLAALVAVPVLLGGGSKSPAPAPAAPLAATAANPGGTAHAAVSLSQPATTPKYAVPAVGWLGAERPDGRRQLPGHHDAGRPGLRWRQS